MDMTDVTDRTLFPSVMARSPLRRGHNKRLMTYAEYRLSMANN